MPIQESSATALVRFTGLGIICFDQENRRGEIGILRDNDKHTLTIKIQRPFYEEGLERDSITYRDLVSYEALPKDDVRVEIKALNAPIAGCEIYRNGEHFDRLDSADPNDFRWFVSLDSLHGESDLSPISQQPYPLTKVYIDDGLFYAHKLDRALFFQKVEKDANGVESHSEEFGNVAETLGVKIEGDEVRFTIRIGEQEKTHILPRMDGLPFRIEFRNVNENTNAIYSDMPDYYKYIASSSGEQFELKPVEDDSVNDDVPSAGSVNQEDFCHPVVFPLRSIDEL